MKQIAMTALPNIIPIDPNNTWVAACQDDGYARVIQDKGVRVIECGIKNAKDQQVGARVFYNDSLGRWLTLQEAFKFGNILISYDVWIGALSLVDGENKWLTCGVEIKDDLHPNALVQTNLAQIGSSFYYWLNGTGLGSCPVPLNKWHSVKIELASDYYTLRFADDYLKTSGVTSHDGLAGMAWCFYGNNLATNDTYFARFKNFKIYET